jgi:hypothetical protein
MPIAVSTDGLTVFQASWVAPELWNGWVCPYFARPEADRVVAWIMHDPFPKETVAYDPITGKFHLTIAGTPYLHIYPTVMRDATVLHGIGVEELPWNEIPGGTAH